jgi:hypothetical protein
MGVVAATCLEAMAIVGICLLNVNSMAMRAACLPAIGTAASFWVQNSGPAVIGFASLILIFAMEKGLLSRLLNRSFFVILGEISFAMYMLHAVLLTYRSTNFPHDQSVVACALFLAGLLLASHFMWAALEMPVRKLIIKTGMGLLEFGKKTQMAGERIRMTKRGWLLAGEAIILAAVIYAGIPTIHQVVAADVETLIPGGVVPEANSDPFLQCVKASARTVNGRVSVRMIWKVLNPHTVDSVVCARAFDQNGQALGEIIYRQDGRRQHVLPGVMWCDSFELPIAANSLPAYVQVELARSKPKAKSGHSVSAQAKTPAMVIPVTQ